MRITDKQQLKAFVEKAVDEVQITDVHTHLFTPDFGEQLLWGFDELINYHYLSAETMKKLDMPYVVQSLFYFQRTLQLKLSTKYFIIKKTQTFKIKVIQDRAQ